MGAAAVLVGFLSGGFEVIRPNRLHVSTFWLVIAGATAVAVIVALTFWKPAGESWWERGWSTLRGGVKNFLASRRQFMRGLVLATLVQIALSSVFALIVRAVAGGSLPWLKLAWTFPVVMMLSCLPITVAGAGVLFHTTGSSTKKRPALSSISTIQTSGSIRTCLAK